MGLPLALLVAILIAALPSDRWDAVADATAHPWGAALALVLGVACVSALGAWRTRRALRRSPRNWERFARGYLALRWATQAVLLGGYWWVVDPGRLSAWVTSAAPAAWPDTLRLGCLLAPYAAGAVVRRLAFARLEAELRGAAAPPLARDLRGAALLAVPLAGLLVFLDLVQAVGPLRRSLDLFPSLHWVVLAVPGAALLLFGAPLLLRLAWPTRPVPPGPLRDGLEALCRQAGFRCGDLRLWETTSPRMLNAAVTGLLPRWRTVFLTVPLLRHLTPAQARAVLAHEIAHARRRHLLTYAVFGAGFVVWLLVVHDVGARAFGPDSLGYLALLAALALAYWGGWFGVVSRRFERQADLDGAATVGDPEAMAGALERVAAIADQPRRRRQWRHGSIASRVAAVRAAAQDPAVRARDERTARRLAWSAPALLVTGLLVHVPVLRVEMATGCMRLAAQRGDAAAAELWHARALRVRAPDAGVYQAWGEACEDLGRLVDARAAYRHALGAPDCGGDRRRRLEARLAELARPPSR